LVKTLKFFPQLNKIENITTATNQFLSFPFTKKIAKTNKNMSMAPIYAGASTIGCFPQYNGAYCANSFA
jgi:hypothetical protein